MIVTLSRYPVFTLLFSPASSLRYLTCRRIRPGRSLVHPRKEEVTCQTARVSGSKGHPSRQGHNRAPCRVEIISMFQTCIRKFSVSPRRDTDSFVSLLSSVAPPRKCFFVYVRGKCERLPVCCVFPRAGGHECVAVMLRVLGVASLVTALCIRFVLTNAACVIFFFLCV